MNSTFACEVTRWVVNRQMDLSMVKFILKVVNYSNIPRNLRQLRNFRQTKTTNDLQKKLNSDSGSCKVTTVIDIQQIKADHKLFYLLKHSEKWEEIIKYPAMKTTNHR